MLGVDGTTAELAALDAVDARRHRRACSTWLRTSTDAERRARLLQPDRSDVIVAGVLIVREVLRHLGLDRIAPSARDLLDGVALEAAALPEPAEGEAPPGGLYLLLTQIFALATFSVLEYLRNQVSEEARQ